MKDLDLICETERLTLTESQAIETSLAYRSAWSQVSVSTSFARKDTGSFIAPHANTNKEASWLLEQRWREELFPHWLDPLTCLCLCSIYGKRPDFPGSSPPPLRRCSFSQVAWPGSPWPLQRDPCFYTFTSACRGCYSSFSLHITKVLTTGE